MEHDAAAPGACEDAALLRTCTRGDAPKLAASIAEWLAGFGAAKPFTRDSERVLLDAVRAACEADSAACVSLLLHTTATVTRSADCALHALTIAAGAGAERALAAVLTSPELQDHMQWRGPRAVPMLAEALAAALRASLAAGSPACLNTLLRDADRPGAPAAAARAALAPHMRGVFAEAAARGARGALQALLVCLPEHFEALDAAALHAARAAGQHEAANDIQMLLSLRAAQEGGAAGGCAAAAPAATQPQSQALQQLQSQASAGAGSLPDVCVLIDAACCPSPGGARCGARGGGPPAPGRAVAKPAAPRACSSGGGGASSLSSAPSSSVASDCSAGSVTCSLASSSDTGAARGSGDGDGADGGAGRKHAPPQLQLQQHHHHQHHHHHHHHHAAAAAPASSCAGQQPNPFARLSSGPGSPPGPAGCTPVHPYMMQRLPSGGCAGESPSPAPAAPQRRSPRGAPAPAGERAPGSGPSGGGGGEEEECALRAALRGAICGDDVARAARLLTELVDAAERAGAGAGPQHGGGQHRGGRQQQGGDDHRYNQQQGLEQQQQQQQQQQPLDEFVVDLVSAAAASGACDCAHLLLTAVGGNDDDSLKARAARALCVPAAAAGRTALLRVAAAHHLWVGAALSANGAALGRECVRAAVLLGHPHTAAWVARALPCAAAARAEAESLLAAPAWALAREADALARGACGAGAFGGRSPKKPAAAPPDAAALVAAFTRAWDAAA